MIVRLNDYLAVKSDSNTTTHQQAVGIRALERVLGKLADELRDGQSVGLTDVVQQPQRMVLKYTVSQSSQHKIL